MSTIAGVILTGKNLATVLRGFNAAKMEIELNITGPYTVFATSEIATGKLTPGKPGERVRMLSTQWFTPRTPLYL